MTTGDGTPASVVAPGTPLVLEARHTIRETPAIPSFELTCFRSTDNVIVYDRHFSVEDMGIDELVAGTTYHVRFRLRANLTRGQYDIGLYVTDTATTRWVGLRRPAAYFQVAERRSYRKIADLAVGVTTIPAT